MNKPSPKHLRNSLYAIWTNKVLNLIVFSIFSVSYSIISTSCKTSDVVEGEGVREWATIQQEYAGWQWCGPVKRVMRDCFVGVGSSVEVCFRVELENSLLEDKPKKDKGASVEVVSTVLFFLKKFCISDWPIVLQWRFLSSSHLEHICKVPEVSKFGFFPWI